jgi:hypothetical protein
MAAAAQYVAERQDSYDMARDDNSSDGGIVDEKVLGLYEYEYNGGVMGYMSHAESVEEPAEGFDSEEGENPDGDRWNWNARWVMDPATGRPMAVGQGARDTDVDIAPTTPTPTGIERETSDMLLTALPQPDQLQADPEPPAGSDTALPMPRQDEDLAAYRSYHAAFYRGRMQQEDIDAVEANIEAAIHGLARILSLVLRLWLLPGWAMWKRLVTLIPICLTLLLSPIP